MHTEAQQLLRKTPRQARAKVTLEVLLEATSQVLVDRGYAGLTTTRVAERAGVSVGTLYQYFTSKEELIRALHKTHVERAFGALAARAKQSDVVPLEVRIEAMLRALLEVKAERPALSTAIHATMLELDGPAYLRDTITQTQSLVVAVLNAYQDDFANVDVELAAFILTNAVDGVMGSAIATGRLDDSRLIDALTRLVIGYLRSASTA